MIAGGDWNAVPAADPDPPADNAASGHARRKLDRAAAQAIEEAGFTDVAAHLGDPAPTVGHTGPDRLAYRCDRIYTTLPAEVVRPPGWGDRGRSCYVGYREPVPHAC